MNIQLLAVVLVSFLLAACNSSDDDSPPSIQIANLSAPEMSTVKWSYTLSAEDADSVQVEWSQVDGPQVLVTQQTTGSVTLETPEVLNDEVAVFQIVTIDSLGTRKSTTAELTITANMRTLNIEGFVDTSTTTSFEVTGNIGSREVSVATSDNNHYSMTLSVDDSEINDVLTLTAISAEYDSKIEFVSQITNIGADNIEDEIVELTWRNINGLRLSNVSTALFARNEIQRTLQNLPAGSVVNFTTLGVEKVFRYAVLHSLANQLIVSGDAVVDVLGGLSTSQMLKDESVRTLFYAALYERDPWLVKTTEDDIRKNNIQYSQPMKGLEDGRTLYQVTDDPRTEGMFIQIDTDGSGLIAGRWPCYRWSLRGVTSSTIHWNDNSNTLQLYPQPQLPYLGSWFPPQSVYSANVEARQHLVSRELVTSSYNNGTYWLSMKDSCIGKFVPYGQTPIDDIVADHYSEGVFVDSSKVLSPPDILVEGTTFHIAIPSITALVSDNSTPLSGELIARNAKITINNVENEQADVNLSYTTTDGNGELVEKNVVGVLTITEQQSINIVTDEHTWEFVVLDVQRPYTYMAIKALNPNDGNVVNASSGIMLVEDETVELPLGTYMLDQAHEADLKFSAVRYEEDGRFLQISARDRNNDGTFNPESEVTISTGLWRRNAKNSISAKVFRHPEHSYVYGVSEPECVPDSFDSNISDTCVLLRERRIDAHEKKSNKIMASTTIATYQNALLDQKEEELKLHNGYSDNRVWIKIEDLPPGVQAAIDNQ